MENEGLKLGKREQLIIAISTIEKELYLLKKNGIIYEDEPSYLYGKSLIELLEKRSKSL